MTKDPYILKVCKQCWDYGYCKPLDKLLKRKPGLLRIAVRNQVETQIAEEEIPFRPFPSDDEIDKIKGQYELGYINHNLDMAGLDPLDFTRGLFICGEIGSGKSYPVLRILKQMLSIPKKDRDFNVIVIQVVKRDADFLIKSHPNLRIIEFENLRYNMFEVEPWDNADEKINTSISVFSTVNYLMSLTQPILKVATRLAQKQHSQISFSSISCEINNAVKILGQSGYESRNSVDKIRLRIAEFLDTGNVSNCTYGYPIESFF